MAWLSAEHAELVLDVLLALFLSQFSIFSKMGGGFGGGGLGAGGALCLVGALVLGVLLLGFTLGVGGGGGGAFGGGVGQGGSGGLGLARNFRFALPVPGVNGLCKSAVTIKGAGFANAGNFILDVVGETTVKDVAESAITIAVDLASEAVKLDHILVDFLSFFHGQIIQLVFSISDRVVRAEVGFQFGDELGIVVHP